jgi:hypothetical protein
MKSFKRKTLVTIETERRLLIAQYNARHIRWEACGEQIDRVFAPEPEARSLSGPAEEPREKDRAARQFEEEGTER